MKYWLKFVLAMVKITTWDELWREFLKKYYPIGKINQFKRAITSFVALDEETFHQS